MPVRVLVLVLVPQRAARRLPPRPDAARRHCRQGRG
jgi:hypothetical protein